MHDRQLDNQKQIFATKGARESNGSLVKQGLYQCLRCKEVSKSATLAKIITFGFHQPLCILNLSFVAHDLNEEYYYCLVI